MFDTACEFSGIPRNADERYEALARLQFLDGVIPSMFGMLTSVTTRSILVAAEPARPASRREPLEPCDDPIGVRQQRFGKCLLERRGDCQIQG